MFHKYYTQYDFFGTEDDLAKLLTHLKNLNRTGSEIIGNYSNDEISLFKIAMAMDCADQQDILSNVESAVIEISDIRPADKQDCICYGPFVSDCLSFAVDSSDIILNKFWRILLDVTDLKGKVEFRWFVFDTDDINGYLKYDANTNFKCKQDYILTVGIEDEILINRLKELSNTSSYWSSLLKIADIEGTKLICQSFVIDEFHLDEFLDCVFKVDEDLAIQDKIHSVIDDTFGTDQLVKIHKLNVLEEV